MNNHLETMFKEMYRDFMLFEPVRETLEPRLKASGGRQQEEFEDSLPILLGLVSREAFADKYTFLSELVGQFKRYRFKRNAYVHCNVNWKDGRWIVSHPTEPLEFTEAGLRDLANEAMRLEGNLRVELREALNKARMRIAIREAVSKALETSPS